MILAFTFSDSFTFPDFVLASIYLYLFLVPGVCSLTTLLSLLQASCYLYLQEVVVLFKLIHPLVSTILLSRSILPKCDSAAFCLQSIN